MRNSIFRAAMFAFIALGIARHLRSRTLCFSRNCEVRRGFSDAKNRRKPDPYSA